jgi:energy-coupling factor transport system ATP-binding protein
MRPRHLVLDGQMAHLDGDGQERALAALEAITMEGTGVVLADHRADSFAARHHRLHRLAVLADGGLVAHGPPEPIVAGPARVAVAVAAVTTLDEPAGHSPRPPANAPDIVLEDVHFRYPSGVAALSGVDLRIDGGETVALVGPNGGGKTTLAQHLVGLLRPSRGRVLVDGRDIAGRHVADLARIVALGFQDPERQLFARRVRDEVAFGPRQLERRGMALDEVVDRALRAVGLEDRAAAHPGDLGESDRKLLTLASLLAMGSPILVMDEPTAGLDDAGVAIVARVVAEQRARGRTVVAISHDEHLVARAFERIVRLDAGRVIDDRRA